MTLITSFESSSPKPDIEEAKTPEVDYLLVMKALYIDLAGAEVAFARAAKKQFIGVLSEVPIKRLTSSEFENQTPCWHMSAGVALDVRDSNEEQQKNHAKILEELVLTSASQVFHYADEKKKLALVDALNTSIKKVGESMFNFQVKQKWGQVV